MTEEEFIKIQKEGKVEEIKEEEPEKKEPIKKMPSITPILEDYEPFLEELRRREVGGGRFLNQIVGTAQFSTLSLAWVDVTGLTITTRVGLNKRVLLMFATNTMNSLDGGINYFTFNVNGVDINGANNGLNCFERRAGDGWEPISLSFITDRLATGFHTFRVRMRVSANNGLIVAPGTTAIFQAIELS